MLSLVNALFRTYIRRYQSELATYARQAEELQEATLASILSDNVGTHFGQVHRFQELLHQPLSSYSHQVPVHAYEHLLPYIQRVLAGEPNILTAEAPDWIATTSGTTGATKYIPLPRVAITESYRKGSWLSLACLYNKKPDITVFSSKNLLIGGSIKGDYPGVGVPYGDISAIMIRTIPRVMQPFYIPDLSLATHTNYEEKIEKIAQLAAKESGLTVLGGVPTWNLPLFRRILEIHGGDTMLDVWPEAQAFKHGGVNFGPYRAQFEALFPKEGFIFQEIYNATEGFFAVQDQDDDPGMLLLLTNGIYYEFVPFHLFQQGEYQAANIGEVNTQEVYVMLITTNAGLYRYPMGDLIQFTSLAPYRIRILGRTQEFINAFGEDLLRVEAEEALQQTCEQYKVEVADFTIAPFYPTIGQNGYHEWLVEFLQQPADMAAFSHSLDLALQGRNYNYHAKRLNDFGMRPLKLHALPKGFFRAWLASKGKIGGQSKIPRLSNNRTLVEELLMLISNE